MNSEGRGCRVGCLEGRERDKEIQRKEAEKERKERRNRRKQE